MNQSSLDTLATHLATHLDCTQDVACRQIMQAMAETGQPLAPVHLARRLQMRQEDLTAHLVRVPDTEFDEQGNIVGWGITLLPTQHQFRLKERPLFTWCAFDTVLFPPLLQVEAHVQSVCEASGLPITFVATPEGIVDLFPATSVLSLILPAARYDCVRGTFCQQSLFFQGDYWLFRASHRLGLLLIFLPLNRFSSIWEVDGKKSCVGLDETKGESDTCHLSKVANQRFSRLRLGLLSMI